jgi:Tfp pilus assembly protein PilF
MGEFNSILARTDLAPSRWKEDSHYNLGLLHMVRHDQDAVEHLRKAEEAKFDLDLNKKAAKLLAAIGGWKGEHGQELVDFVSTGTALLSVGEVRLARGQFERAIEMEGDVERDNATPLPPDGLEALAYLGYIDWLEGKELSAEERLDRFAHLRADSPLGYYFLGVLRRSQGRLKEAAAEFQRAIGIDPKSAPAYVEMGRTLVLQRDYNGAAAAFECAVEIDPDNVGYLLQAARFYLDHALRPDRALEIAERATHLAPDSAETLDMLGWGLWANGRTYDARYSLERAVETDPELASAHYHLAVLLEKTGDEQASAQEFQRAVEVDSSGNYAAEAEEALRTLGAHH